MEYIYDVRAISMDKLEECDIIKKFELYKAFNPNKIVMSYENYKSLHYPFYPYNFDSFLSSMHETLEEAQEYVTQNIGDINESGSYNYAVVSKIPLSISYYTTEQNPNEDFWIYKYNNETHQYELLSKDSLEYKSLLSYSWGFISLR